MLYDLIAKKSDIIVFMLLSIFYNVQYSAFYHGFFKILIPIAVLISLISIFSSKGYLKLIGNIFLIGFIYIIMSYDSRFVVIYLMAILIWDRRFEIKDFILLNFIVTLIIFIICILFGFSHKNSAAIMFILIVIQLQILFKLNFKIHCFIIALSIVMYLFLKSEQLLVCIFLWYSLNIGKKYKFIRSFLKSKVMTLIFPITVFLNFFMASSLVNYYFKFSPFLSRIWHSIAKIMDKILSYRLSFNYLSVNLYGYKLIGNAINENKVNLQDRYFNVDSSYTQILQSRGLLVLVVISIIMTLVVWYLQKNNLYEYIIFAIIISFLSLIEYTLLTMSVNIIILFIPIALKYFLSKKRKEAY